MLFDLKGDPSETRNLAEDPGYGDTVFKLQETLYANWGDNFEEQHVDRAETY